MDTQSEKNEETAMYAMQSNWEQEHRRGKIVGGIMLVAAGTLYLASQMGVLIPHWIFTWQFLLITIGLYIGIKHLFRGFGWLIPMFIGGAFLLSDIYPELPIGNYIWPIAIILGGLAMIFRPRKYFGSARWKRHFGHQNWKQYKYQYRNNWNAQTTDNDFMQIDTVFGSVNKSIISKDFKGGEINTVFGSAKINLTQADFNGSVVLEINNVFGGTQIIVPSHWEIKSELTAVMGGVEDKRTIYKDINNTSGKVLILKGAAVFGGIEILSF